LLKFKPLAGRLAGTEAAEIAEAALVLPLVFMLLLGIIWFGRAFNIYSTIQQAAQQGAIKAARATCATCDPTFFPSDTAVSNAVEAVMKSSNLDTTQIMANAPAPAFCTNPPYPTGACTTSADNITVCRSVLLNPPASTQAQCGTVVSFQYPYKFYLPFTSLNLEQIVLSAQAQSRMEN
jgi:Flp pilus assembly protein TadG